MEEIKCILKLTHPCFNPAAVSSTGPPPSLFSHRFPMSPHQGDVPCLPLLLTPCILSLLHARLRILSLIIDNKTIFFIFHGLSKGNWTHWLFFASYVSCNQCWWYVWLMPIFEFSFLLLHSEGKSNHKGLKKMLLTSITMIEKGSGMSRLIQGRLWVCTIPFLYGIPIFASQHACS